MRAPLAAVFALCAAPRAARARLAANAKGSPQELRNTTNLCAGRTERKHTCSVLLDVPQECSGETSACPIAFMFHGGGGSGTGFINNGGAAVHAAAFIGVYPTGDDGWNTDGDKGGDECAWDDYACTKDNDELAFVAAMIAALRQMGATGGVYCFGTSNGADLAQKVASNAGAQLPVKGIWAASTQLLKAPLRSGPGPWYNQPNASTPKVAQVASHGTEDTVIPYAGGHAGVHNKAGDAFVLMPELDSDQFWADHNGCSGPPTATNVSATRGGEALTAVHYVWHGCPITAPVELYEVVGAPHGDASTIGGVGKLEAALAFFRRVDGTPAPPTAPPAPAPPAPAPVPPGGAPPAACQACWTGACPGLQHHASDACRACVAAHQHDCAGACRPYPFGHIAPWFCAA